MRAPVELTEDEVEHGLKWVVREGLFARAMESLTGGVVLVGLAVALNASNFLIGVLAALPFLASLLQIPAIWVIEHVRDRRAIVFWLCLGSRAMLLPAFIAPLLPDHKTGLWLLTVAMTLRYAVGGMVSCAWNSWMRDLVPEERLGRFFGLRELWLAVMGIACGLGAALFLDWRAGLDAVQVYGPVMALGFVAAMTSTFLIRRIPHPPMPHPHMSTGDGAAPGRLIDWSLLARPFRDRNFRRLMGFLVSWNFAVNLAAPFFAVYMLKTLGYDFATVMVLTLLSQVANAAAFRVWGRYADRFSHRTVIAVCGMAFLLCILGWTFTTFPNPHRYTLPMVVGLHIVMGVAMAGMTLSVANIALKLAPRAGATPYLAVNGMMSSLAAGIAPLIGGGFADWFAGSRLSLDLHWQGAGGDLTLSTLYLEHWDFFFLLAFLLGLAALRRLARVEEAGTVESGVILRELMADTGRVLRTLSSVGGLRALAGAPISLAQGRLRGGSGR